MKQKDLLFILISAAGIVLIWIIFNIIHTSVSTTISAPINEDIAPISGNFDTKTIDTLKKRAQVQPASGINALITPSPTPTPPPITPVLPLGVTQPLATGGANASGGAQ